MQGFITFTNSSSTTNENAYNDLHSRIMNLKGLPTPDGSTKDWAQPLAHPTQSWCAMYVDDSCLPAMTQTEIASIQTRDQLASAGWLPDATTVGKTPWWGFLVWWK